MNDIDIVIPSRGRAGQVKTAISGAVFWVREEEVDDYRNAYPDREIIGHPPFANLATKRQAIYEHYGDVAMVDDDIEGVRRLWSPSGELPIYLTPDQARDLIQATYRAAINADCYLFGFSNYPNPKHYLPGKPIKMNGYINGSAFGIRKSDSLYFTERTTAAESYWMTLLNAYAHRKAWIDTRFCFAQAKASLGRLSGGQTANRTLGSERKDTIFLRRMFGPAIVLKPIRGESANVHQYQRVVNIPL